MEFRTALALALSAVLLGAAGERPPVDAAEAERIYTARFDALIKNPRGELPAYDPLEAVEGAARPTPIAIATPSKKGLSPAAIEAARATAAAANSSAFMVWRDGALVAESYFGGATRDTPIVSKSLAKPLTAIAIGRAIKLGKIRSLDQPVADFIPQWRGTPKEAMLVRHLLDMRAGLLAQSFSTDPANIWSRAYLHPMHEKILIEDYPLTDPPGSIYEYANATSELVAPVIEAATGMRYADFIGRHVLQPIGAAGGEVWINREGGVAHSGCCIMLPARTWLKLGILLLNNGQHAGERLLPNGYVAEMRTATAQNPWYGLGLWVAGPYAERRGFANPARPGPKVLHSEPWLAADVFMFDGNSNQLVMMVPSAKLIVLRTGNSPPRMPEWDNAAFLNGILRGLEPGAARLRAQAQ